MIKKISLCVILFALLLSACQAAPAPATPTVTAEIPTATVEPSATPVPPRTLTVCLAEEPETLYPYGGASRSMWNVLEGIYDGPFDTSNFSVQPVILDKTPNTADGDAVIAPVNVQAGDPVVDLNGNLVALAAGTRVLPAGCRTPDCAVTWDGSVQLQMDQMTVKFTLKAGVNWSDGAPVLATDSVFSYNIAADPATPVTKGVIDRTASYTALDERSVEWVGVPGFIDPAYQTFFFLPLPQHAWGGMNASQLLADPTVRTAPLGWGAFTVEEWVAGDHIRLKKNPAYFRAAEGLPHYDYVDFRFTGSPADGALMALVDGKCDIVDQEPGFLRMMEELINTENNGRLKLYFQQGPEIEQLFFGIRPASYDDLYDPSTGDRPDLLGDVRTRQAIGLCIDRAGMTAEFFNNRGQVPNGSLPPNHPGYAADVAPLGFDPAQGTALLDQAGWKDFDNNPDTPRTAAGVVGVPDGTPLQLSLLTSNAALRQEVARRVAASLTACGVGVTSTLMSPADLFAAGPAGPLFGRNFDLGIFAWGASSRPGCSVFTSSQIPSAAMQWIGANISGYSNSALDSACQSAALALPGEADRAQRWQAAERVLAEQLPALPLFFQLKVAISRPDLCGLSLDGSARSLMTGIELLDAGETCGP